MKLLPLEELKEGGKIFSCKFTHNNFDFLAFITYEAINARPVTKN